MKKYFWVIIIIFISVIAAFVTVQRLRDSEIKRLRIGDVEIKYEIASTAREVELGLSYRESIPENYGMLFVFPEKGLRTFWMHEMLFPLDMIWIDGDKIVQIDKNVPIKTNGAWTVVNSNYPVDKVLEMKGGEVERLGIKLNEGIRQ